MLLGNKKLTCENPPMITLSGGMLYRISPLTMFTKYFTDSKTPALEEKKINCHLKQGIRLIIQKTTSPLIARPFSEVFSVHLSFYLYRRQIKLELLQ